MSQPNEPVNTSTMVSLLCDLFSFGYIHCLKRSLVLPGYVLLKKHEVKVIKNAPFSQNREVLVLRNIVFSLRV